MMTALAALGGRVGREDRAEFNGMALIKERMDGCFSGERSLRRRSARGRSACDSTRRARETMQQGNRIDSFNT